jgi:MFS family permease
MPAAASPAAEPNRWAVLALLGVAQLMVVLDSTIVNIALPSAQRDLGFSTGNRQWIVTAYALAFGSLLLVGGKLGDLFGRKWTFIGGLMGFSVASVLGGLAPSFGVLVAARALQGIFGALLAPSALSLLTVTFADSPERPKAFGIFAAVATSGASVGLLLGGALTDALSWRWCLYVNLLIAIPAAVVALRLLVNERQPERPRIDAVGVALACSGLFGIVFGFSRAETESCSRSPSGPSSSSPSCSPSAASRTRCCRCTSSGTAPAEGRSPRSPSPERASSPSSSSSRSSCSRTWATRPCGPASASCR